MDESLFDSIIVIVAVLIIFAVIVGISFIIYILRWLF